MDLFAESITSGIGFRAVQCDSYDSFLNGTCDGNISILMGEPTPLKYFEVQFSLNTIINVIFYFAVCILQALFT